MQGSLLPDRCSSDALRTLEKYRRSEKSLDKSFRAGRGSLLPPWRVKRNMGLERCHGNGFQ